MTAINIVVRDGFVLMCTDGAISEKGVVSWVGSKPVLFPHLGPAAFAATGSSVAACVAADYIGGGARDFDHLVDTMAEAMTVGMADNADGVRRHGGEAAYDIHAVGWSYRANGFKIYTCSFVPGGVPTTREAGAVLLQPGDDAMIASIEAAGILPELLLEADVPRATADLGTVMRVQRAEAFKRGEIIGGFQQLTFITQGGIFSRILDFWNDPVVDVPRV